MLSLATCSAGFAALPSSAIVTRGQVESDSIEWMGFRPYLGFQGGYLSQDSLDQTGVPMAIQVLGSRDVSIVAEPTKLDIGLGWSSLMQRNARPGTALNAVQLESAVRWQFAESWQAGPILTGWIGAQDQLKSQLGLLTAFAGGQVIRELNEVKDLDVRLGAAAQVGVLQAAGNLWNVGVVLQIGFGEPALTLPPTADSGAGLAQRAADAGGVSKPDLGKEFSRDWGVVGSSSQDRESLAQLANQLNMPNRKNDQLVILGSSGSVEAGSMAEKLAQWRAQDTASILQQQGVPAERILVGTDRDSSLVGRLGELQAVKLSPRQGVRIFVLSSSAATTPSMQEELDLELAPEWNDLPMK